MGVIDKYDQNSFIKPNRMRKKMMQQKDTKNNQRGIPVRKRRSQDDFVKKEEEITTLSKNKKNRPIYDKIKYEVMESNLLEEYRHANYLDYIPFILPSFTKKAL